MKITTKFLKEKGVCKEGYNWVKENKLIGLDAMPFINKLIENNKLKWANWLIVRCMEYKQYVAYAVFAAEQVISIYEKNCPKDDRPRKAVKAAKLCIDNPTEKNKNAAYVAAACAVAAVDAAAAACAVDAVAYAAAAAAYAVDAACAVDAYAVAYAAAYAACAAYAAACAAYVVDAACAVAAVDAACAVDAVAYAVARKEMQLKILRYGLQLLENMK